MDVAAANRVEPRHRLVEEDDLGIVDERLRDAHALQHPLGELPQLHPALRANLHFVQPAARPHSALRAADAEEAREVLQQLLGRQVVVEVGVLGKVAETALHRHIARRPAQDLGRPAGRVDELHEQLEGGGLARSVGAEEAEDLAGGDRQRDRVQRPVGTRAPEADEVVLAQPVGGDRGAHTARIIGLPGGLLQFHRDERVEVRRRHSAAHHRPVDEEGGRRRHLEQPARAMSAFTVSSACA